jgi:hypothetical protein
MITFILMKSRNRICVVALIIVSFSLPGCDKDDCSCNNNPTTKTLTLQPNSNSGKDAVLSDIEFLTNYGSHPEITALAWTCGGSPCLLRSLLEFDLSTIPEGSTIKNAKLSLYSWTSGANGSHSTQGGSNQSLLQRVTSNWSEDVVNWNTQPSVTTTNQVTLPASSSTIQHYTDIDVADLVQDMIDDPDNSFGFLFRQMTEQSTRKMVFASSDHTDSGLHPKLVIEYEE